MVAGGGASVIYADTISDLGAGAELANYGEYSGDPSEALTYEYAKTILSLLTKSMEISWKFLI
jgi:ATP citrate (pro-S)-lyase